DVWKVVWVRRELCCVAANRRVAKPVHVFVDSLVFWFHVKRDRFNVERLRFHLKRKQVNIGRGIFQKEYEGERVRWKFALGCGCQSLSTEVRHSSGFR